MNNKMAVNTYLSISESKKQIKQTKKPETKHRFESVLMLAGGKRGYREM